MSDAIGGVGRGRIAPWYRWPAILALVVAASVITSGHLAVQQTGAAIEQAKTEMHLEIEGTLSGQPVSCDSRAQNACELQHGSLFSLRVVPNAIPVGGYIGWQTLVDFGSLLYRPATQGSSEIKWDLSAAPLRAPLSPTGKEGLVFHSDGTGSPPTPVSMQKSAIVNLEFYCAQNGPQGFSQLVRLIDFNENASGAVFLNGDGFSISVPNTSALTIECSIPPKQEEPGDTDEDGCSDEAENGADPMSGGLRDYFYYWDFFDVWTRPLGDPSGWERNKVLNILDITHVALRFGPGPALSEEEAFVQALIPPTDTFSYHPAYDRGPVVGANTWDRAPPDGSINIVDDIFGVALQFGHTCA